MRKKIVGVFGGSVITEDTMATAVELGELIADQGWILLNGGRNTGVMAASARGAKEAGGTVIGVLPDVDDGQASPHLDIAILTGMHDARNVINVLTSDVVIATPGRGGTISEVALALKNKKKVITVGWEPGPEFDNYRESGFLLQVSTPDEAIEKAKQLLR